MSRKVPKRYDRDYGYDGKPEGGRFKAKGSPHGVCPACGSVRSLPLGAWFRKSKPTCSRCGEYLMPSKKAQSTYHKLNVTAKRTKETHCARCNAKLRAGNKDKLCSPCASLFRKEETWILDSAQSRTAALNRFIKRHQAT